jgi:hypothetical protein
MPVIRVGPDGRPFTCTCGSETEFDEDPIDGIDIPVSPGMCDGCADAHEKWARLNFVQVIGRGH